MQIDQETSWTGITPPSNIVFNDTKFGEAAGIVAKKPLMVQTGNNIEFNAANLSSGGDTSLVAANDVIIKAEEERYFEAISVGRDSSTSLVTTQNSSALNAGGDLRIKAGNSITAVASTLNAADALVLSANLDINIKAAVEEVFSTKSGHRWSQKDRSIRNKSSELSGNYVLLASGNDVTLEGSQISAIHDAAITAKNNVSILAVNDSDYHYFKKTKKKSFGRKKTRIEESMHERVVGSDINAGGNLTIQAKKIDGALIAGGDSNITVIGSQLNAGGLVNLAADGDVVIAAQKYTEFTRNQTIKKGVGGFSSKESVNAHSANKLGSSDLISGSHVSINSGNDVAVLASNLSAEGNVNITAVDEVLVAAGEVLTTSEQWSKKGGLFSGGALYSQQFKLNGNESSTAQSSVIKSGNFVEISAGNVKVVGSDINATDSVKLFADVGDIEIFAAKEYNNSYSEEENLSVSVTGIADTILHPQDIVSVEDGRATVKLAEAIYDKVDSKTDRTTHRSSNIGADNNLSLNAAANVMVEGSNLVADADNDQQGNVNLVAGDSVVIKEATNTTTSTSKEIHGKAEVSVMVQHQAVEVAKAALAVKDAKDKLKESKKEYSQYKKKLASLKGTLATLEQEYADNKPGVNADDIEELKDLVSDVKGDEAWYLAGITLAAADAASKTTQLVQQTAAAAQSAGTYGFNAGLQLDIEASKTKSEQQSTSSLASNVAGNNINIQAGNEAGNQALIQGSHLQATDSLTVAANEVNIVASKDTATSTSETKSGTISASMTVYGASSGLNLNASLNRSQNKSSQTTHTNSTLNADNISITSSGDTNIKGANVEADKQLLVNVGGDLNVESVQDRIKSSNKGMGISAGMSLSGGSVNKNGVISSANNSTVSGANGGVNASNGRTNNKSTVLTTLTSGGDAKIVVAKNTNIKGALIGTLAEDGTDSGKLDLTTDSLTFTDLSNTNYSQSQSIGISSNVGVSATGIDATSNSTSVQYKNQSSYGKTKNLATLGTGNIKINNTADSDDITSLNRDVSNTVKDLFSVDRTQGNFDVTLDHRLLSSDGINSIKEDVKRTEIGVDAVADVTREDSVSVWGDKSEGESSLRDNLMNKQSYFTATKNFVTDNKNQKAVAILNDPTATPEDKDMAYNALSLQVAKELGITPMEAKLAVVKDLSGSAKQGAYVEGKGFINDKTHYTLEDAANTVLHENQHNADAQDAPEVKGKNYDGNREGYSKMIAKDAVGYLKFNYSNNDKGNFGGYNLQVGTKGNKQIASNTQEFVTLQNKNPDAVDFKQLTGSNVNQIKYTAKKMEYELGMNADEAEKMLSDTMLYYTDESFNKNLSKKGFKPTEQALKYLSEALVRDADEYVALKSDVPVERHLSAEDVAQGLKDYKNDFSRDYKDMTKNGKPLISELPNLVKDHYAKNYSSNTGLASAAEHIVGRANGVGEVINENLTGLGKILLAPDAQIINGIKQFGVDGANVVANPSNAFDAFDARVDAAENSEIKSVLQKIQGDHRASGNSEAKAALAKTGIAVDVVSVVTGVGGVAKTTLGKVILSGEKSAVNAAKHIPSEPPAYLARETAQAELNKLPNSGDHIIAKQPDGTYQPRRTNGIGPTVIESTNQGNNLVDGQTVSVKISDGLYSPVKVGRVNGQNVGAARLEIGKVEPFGESKKITGDGSIDRDHMPTVGALLERFKTLNNGLPARPAQKRKIENSGLTVTVPNELHKAGDTYGTKNKILMKQDSNNLEASVKRDSTKMIENAKKLKLNNNDVTKLKKACTDINCRSNQDFDKLLIDIRDGVK